MLKKQLKKQMICREATKLFLEKGFEDTTTREIAMACDITQGNLCYYYPFKYEILTDLYGRFYSQLLIELEKKYGDKIEEAEITILSDMMINRILLSHEKLKRLFTSMVHYPETLCDKIHLTTKVMSDILGKDYEELHFALTMAIGAEAQLLFQMEKGMLSLTPDELTFWVSETVLHHQGFSREEIEESFQKCLPYADAFSVKEFLGRLKQSLGWV